VRGGSGAPVSDIACQREWVLPSRRGGRAAGAHCVQINVNGVVPATLAIAPCRDLGAIADAYG